MGNNQNGGVCICFKENLPIKERFYLEILEEIIDIESNLNRKKIFIVLSYCQPQLPNHEFDDYINSLEKIYDCMKKEYPAITIVTGDFNSRSTLFWED